MDFFGSRPVERYARTFGVSSSINQPVAIGWGRKKSFYKAKKYAENNKSTLICLEDGFIRSMGLGVHGYPALSIVVDRTGIHFDARSSSDLEQLINQDHSYDQAYIQHLIQLIIEHKITKYNCSQSLTSIRKIQTDACAYSVLVVDQTYADQSIYGSGAGPETFQHMLTQALLDHPTANILVKTHPDVLAGYKKGHFKPSDYPIDRISWITDFSNPYDLLQRVKDVYVVSSHLGFEALLAGHKVHCFGVPWYAGWGLTDDQYAPIEILQSRRLNKCTLEHLFVCAYIKYAHYISPVTQQKCELEELLNLIIPNIEFQKKIPNHNIAYKFSPWKKKFISDFLRLPNTQIQFNRFINPNKSQVVLAWGKKALLLKQQGYDQIITVEDGFMRSIGLGARLIRPFSLVFDDIGIYYDATQPSRLEHLLNTTQLSQVQYQRAELLKSSIINLNISKYNVGELTPLLKPDTDKKVLLVVGQVEDDMSIQLGGVDIKTNLELLKQVSLDHPDTYIIYKPHPDVQAGLRKGKISDALVYEYADQLELNASIISCFNVVDEIHTMTSLTGFEALLRNIKVYCYGLPFYAGWGLTVDRFVCTRRKRTLDLNTLTYVTLIDYAVYNLPTLHNSGFAVVSAEHVVEYLTEQLYSKPPSNIPFWKKILTQIKHLKIR